jgi:AcrR family transcriptional regulator
MLINQPINTRAMPQRTRSASPAARDGETEQRILRAARSVFVRRGTSGARMQEIAEEAGVNQALLHYYFRSKEGLAEAVFRETAGRLAPALFQLLGSEATIEHKVERFVQLYIDTVRESPFIPGYIVAELQCHPERITTFAAEIAGLNPAGILRGYLRRLGEQIDAEAAAGRMRRIAPEQLLVNLLSLSVFPFIARPLLDVALEMDDEQFARFLDDRRAELPRFILNALRP